MQDLNEEFYIIRVKKDGNCQFRACLAACRIHENHYVELLENVIQHIKNNKIYYKCKWNINYFTIYNI